jgi:hypothetical protein
MRNPHIVDKEWETSLLILLGACFIGIVVFGLTVAGF